MFKSLIHISNLAKLVIELLQLIRPLQRIHLAFHGVVLCNLVKVLLVLVTVIDANGDTLATETTSAANPVNVGLGVTLLLSVGQVHIGDVKIDDNLDLGHVNTPRKHIGSDDDIDFTLAEFIHDEVSLLLTHVTEHDRGLVVILSEGVLDQFTEMLGIDENDCLSQSASVEDIHYEVDLLFGLASVLVLLNVV